MSRWITSVAVLSLFLAPSIALLRAHAHEGHDHFSAGVPGNPKQPSRIVKVSMREEGNRMLYVPDRIEVRKGEQIRFIISNDGIYNHEFMLATVAENRKHGELMKKYPDMEHEDPNAVTVAPYVTIELLWKFTNAGEFEFACLIPHHYEAGMHGIIIVK